MSLVNGDGDPWRMFDGLAGLGYEVFAVSVEGPPPLGRIHLPIRRGVTALYGRNGAGKSVLLQALTAALTGRQTASIATLHIRVDYGDPADLDACPIAGPLADVLAQRLRRYRSLLDDDELALLSDLLGDLDEEPSQRPTGSTLPELAHLYLLAGIRSADNDPREWYELLHQTARSGCFSLRASGAQSPAWTVYLSAPLTGEHTQLDLTYAAKRASGERLIRFFVDRADDILLGDKEWIQDMPSGTDFPFDRDDAPPSSVEEAFFGTVEARHPAAPRSIGMPVEIARAGVLNTSPVLFHSPAGSTTGLDERTLHWLRATVPGGPRVLVGADDQQVVIDPRYVTALANLSSRSALLLSELLLEAPTLRCSFRHPEEWISSRPLFWEALDWASGEWLPIDQLSKAAERWASVAITLAMSEVESHRPKLVVFDEPEGGLHRSAEVALVDGLCRLTDPGSGIADAVVVATHSPAFVNHARVTPVHIARDLDGFTQAAGLDVMLRDELGRGLTATTLGLNPGDLLQMLRVLVLVEGEQDKIVLEALFGDVFHRCRAYLVPLRGGDRPRSALNAGMLFDFTDAAVAIVLDNDPRGAIGHIWDQASQYARNGDAAAAHRCLSRLESVRSEAALWLREFGEQAVRSHQLGRLAVHVLAKPDIVEYLPAGILVPGASSWGRLVADWKAARASGDNRAFKTYLRGEHHADLSERTLRRAAENLDDLQDLGMVSSMIAEMSRTTGRVRG